MDTRSTLAMRRFELIGTDTAQVTVATLRIVEAVDVVRYVEKSRLSISIDAFLDSLFLQAAEERLGYATGTAERDGALDLIDEMLLGEGCTVGADKGYGTEDFVAGLLERKIKPNVAQNTKRRRSAVPARVARTTGYAISQMVSKRIEQGFGWTKSIGGLRKLPPIGLQKVRVWTAWSFATDNLIRIGGIANWWQPSPT